MLSKQQVINHCREAFIDIIKNQGGICHKGWGKGGNETRCVLGRLAEANSRDVFCDATRVLTGLSYRHRKGAQLFESDREFYQPIMSLNDSHARTPITAIEVNDTLELLAGKYGLDYEPISYLEIHGYVPATQEKEKSLA